MFGHIVRKEILEHMMSLRFAIACVLCFVIVLASVFVRGRDHRIVLADYHEEDVSARKQIEGMRYPFYVIWRGIDIHLPPNPLKIFVRGVEESSRLSAQLNAIRPVQLIAGADANPLAPLFPPMDLVNFAGIILSLLALVFGYDAVCGEKERGTLSLMLSCSVPRDRILLAKWVGGYVMLVIPFLLAVVCGAAVAQVQPDVSLSPAEWTRLAMVCGLALLYLAAMYGLAIWVSCLTSRAATSAMLLVTVWLVLILAIPNLSPYIARAVRPTRNPLEIEMSRTAARNDVRTRVEAAMKVYDKEHGFAEHWWEGFVDGAISDEDQKRINLRQLYELKLEKQANLELLTIYGKQDTEFQHEMDAQVRTSAWLGRVSPFSCFAVSAASITDTGSMQKRRFLDQLRAYQRVLTAYAFDEGIALQEKAVKDPKQRIEWKPSDRLKPFPLFAYVPAGVSDYARDLLVDAGILAAAALMFLLLSHLAFLRYDVR